MKTKDIGFLFGVIVLLLLLGGLFSKMVSFPQFVICFIGLWFLPNILQETSQRSKK